MAKEVVNEYKGGSCNSSITGQGVFELDLLK